MTNLFRGPSININKKKTIRDIKSCSGFKDVDLFKVFDCIMGIQLNTNVLESSIYRSIETYFNSAYAGKIDSFVLSISHENTFVIGVKFLVDFNLK